MKWAILISFCLCTFRINAQDKKQITADSTALANAASYFIAPELLPVQSHTYTYPFDSIIFRDIRFDSTTVGATNKITFLSDKNKFHNIKFTLGLSGFLNSYFNSNQGPSNNSDSSKLICYIKKFRITELDSTYETKVKKQRQVQIKSAIEGFYLYHNRMYPAFKTDTTFLQLLSENKTAYVIIDSLLQIFSNRVSKIDKYKVLKRKSYSEENVDSMYKQRFTLPILNTAIFKKGVYTSKEEFFNNYPSIAEYEWKPDKKINILYTKNESNQWVVTRKNVFGFCDGANIWIKVENSFYPAFHKENTFEFIAPLFLKRSVNNQPATYSMPIGSYIIFMTVPSKYSSSEYKDKSVYQVDMETAEFY